MIAVENITDAAAGGRWRSSARTGAWSEFFLVGGATPLLFALSFVLRRSVGLDSSEFATGFLMFHAAYVVNDPHFAVTYLLFYRDGVARAFGRESKPLQQVRYILAGAVVPMALAAWATLAIATKSAFVLGMMIQLMFFLVGWHYVKQGFGVMVVLAARRGVRFDRRERLAILAHCFAGWAYAWASPADPGTEVEEKVQYIYFVWILRSNEAREREGPPWFERPLPVRLGSLALSALGLGWLLFHGAPSALDAMLVPRGARLSEAALGPTPYFAAIYAFVNLHHFFMDNVIWRRDNPETKYLLRSRS